MRYKLEKRVTSGNKTVGFVVVESPDYTRQVYIQTSNVIMLAKQGKLDNATYDKSKKRIKGLYGVDLRKLPHVSASSLNKPDNLPKSISDCIDYNYFMQRNGSNASVAKYADRINNKASDFDKETALSRLMGRFGGNPIIASIISYIKNELGTLNVAIISDGSYVVNRIYLTSNRDNHRSYFDKDSDKYEISSSARINFEIMGRGVTPDVYLDYLVNKKIKIVLLQF